MGQVATQFGPTDCLPKLSREVVRAGADNIHCSGKSLPVSHRLDARAVCFEIHCVRFFTWYISSGSGNVVEQNQRTEAGKL